MVVKLQDQWSCLSCPVVHGRVFKSATMKFVTYSCIFAQLLNLQFLGVADMHIQWMVNHELNSLANEAGVI